MIIGDIIDIDGTERFNSFQHQIESSDFNFNLDYLIDQPLTDLLNQVSQLTPRTAIYYMGSFKDVNGKFTAPEEVIEVISARANAPIFSHWDIAGENIVGGYQIS